MADHVVSHQTISFAAGRARIVDRQPEADIGAAVLAAVTAVIVVAAVRERLRHRFLLVLAAVVGALCVALSVMRTTTTIGRGPEGVRRESAVAGVRLAHRRVGAEQIQRIASRRVMVGEWPGQQEIWIEARVVSGEPLLLVRLRGGGWEDERRAIELVDAFEAIRRGER